MRPQGESSQPVGRSGRFFEKLGYTYSAGVFLLAVILTAQHHLTTSPSEKTTVNRAAIDAKKSDLVVRHSKLTLGDRAPSATTHSTSD